MIYRSIFTGISLAFVAACAQTPLTYEEKIDAYNARVEKNFNTCMAEPFDQVKYAANKSLRPDKEEVILTHSDSLCTFSNSRVNANQEVCTGNYRRKRAALTSQRHSCEAYHAVYDSDDTLMLEVKQLPSGKTVQAIPKRALSEREKWLGDLYCPYKAQSLITDVTFEPYEYARNKRRFPKPLWSHIGWHMTFPDGTKTRVEDFEGTNKNPRCHPVWRYEVFEGRLNFIRVQLGYSS